MATSDREAPHARGASPADLQGWYVDELQPKLARAAAQGRIDPGRACALHRLMGNLLQSPRVTHSGAEASQ